MPVLNWEDTPEPRQGLPSREALATMAVVLLQEGTNERPPGGTGWRSFWQWEPRQPWFVALTAGVFPEGQYEAALGGSSQVATAGPSAFPRGFGFMRRWPPSEISGHP